MAQSRALTEKPVRTRAALLFDEEGSTEVSPNRDSPAAITDDQLLWVDRGDGGPTETEDALEMEEKLLERLGEEPGRPSLVTGEHAILVTMQVPVEGHEFSGVRCLVGHNWVVTAHDGRAVVIDRFRELAEGSGELGSLDGPSFLATLLEWVFDAYREAFEAVEAELEEFDVRALEGRLGDPDEEVRGLVRHRQNVGRLRRELVRHRVIVRGLAHSELDALSTQESASRFTALVERLEESAQAARDGRDAVVASFDVIIARSEHRTNQIMKVLALVTVLFLPGSFLAGLMGVNFELGFFSNGAYFWVLVSVIAASAISTLVVARVRGWI